jgi:hypothetical protein
MSRSTPLTSRRPSRRAAFASVALVATLASCAAPAASNWTTFAPEGGGFSVSLPGVPTRDHQFPKNESGSFEMNVYTLVLDGGGFFTVAESKLPPNVDTKDGADAVLDSACDRVVASASARLVAKQTIFLSGHAGRQIEANVPESAVAGGATLRGRVYLVGGRLYELAAVVPRPAASAAATNRFLDSFEVKEP